VTYSWTASCDGKRAVGGVPFAQFVSEDEQKVGNGGGLLPLSGRIFSVQPSRADLAKRRFKAVMISLADGENNI